MNRHARLFALAGMALPMSTAFADTLVYDAMSPAAGNPRALFANAANGPLTFFAGGGVTIVDPTPDTIALTGLNLQIANGTGVAIPAGSIIRVTAFVWDFEDAASAGTVPAFQTLLLTAQGDLPLGGAWPQGTLLTIAAANPTLPGFEFANPVTGFTDNEMALSFSVQAGDGTTFNSVDGLSVIYRSAAVVGQGDNYIYLSEEAEADGNFLGENAFQIGGVTNIAMQLFNATTFATPLGVGESGTIPAVPVSNCNGGDVSLNVVVTPGTLPDSTGITVTADTTSLGGAPNTALLDDGFNNDGAAGDNEFGLILPLPAGPEAQFNIPFVVADAEARTANGEIVVNRDTTPALPAQIDGGGSGSNTIAGVRRGLDDDMHAICVFDANNFGASVVGGATWDTQLFLFDEAGLGILHNDNDPNDLNGLTLQSNITGFPLAVGGRYNLLITGFNRDPMNNVNQLIWNDDDGAGNRNTVRPADGPGAATPIALFLGAGNEGGPYTITLTGANSVCPADLTNSLGENSPDCAVTIDDLLFFLTGFENGDTAVDLTDPVGGPADCAVTIDDLLFFLTRFEGGC